MADSVAARALWFAAERVAELRDEPVRRGPAADEVLVRGLYSLISTGTELNVYRGQIKTENELMGLSTARGHFPFPVKYAYQVVGEVIEAGAASGLSAGDIVFAQHPHQDFFVITKDLVFRVPEGLSPRAATFGNLACVALTGLLDVPVRAGDTVVVSGGGVVGTLAASIARRAADLVVLVEPTSRGELARAVSDADHVISPDKAVDLVRELTGGRMADIWVEASGNGAALQTALEGTGLEGEIVPVSYYGSRTINLQLAPEFIFRRQRIVGTYVGYTGSGLQPRWDRQRRMDVSFRHLMRIDAERMISHQLPFDKAPEAYPLLDGGAEEAFAVVLDYGA